MGGTSDWVGAGWLWLTEARVHGAGVRGGRRLCRAAQEHWRTIASRPRQVDVPVGRQNHGVFINSKE